MKALFFFLSGICLISSCKSTSITPQDFKGKQLIIANGGGFTGQVIEYILLENGYLFRKNSLDGSVLQNNKLKKEAVSQLFRNYEVLNLGELDLNDPGNMYFYIVLKEEDHEHKITWSSESSGEDYKRAKLFYQTMMSMIKN